MSDSSSPPDSDNGADNGAEEGENVADFNTLSEAMAASQIELAAETTAQLDAYRALLWQWNEKLNLTRHTTFARFVERDVIDTMQLAEHLPQGSRILDIGSGGGVPGLVLAILRPDLDVSVCDSVAKKSRVLQEMVASLNLPVRVYAARAQEVLELATFDTLVARAVAPIRKFLNWLDPHWDAFDELLLIKGRKWVDERGEARHHGLMHDKELRRLTSYETRDGGESVILRIRPVDSDD